MRAVLEDREWTTRRVDRSTVEGPPHRPAISCARSRGAWHCGDPGMQYDTTINDWHTCKTSGRINASNPCSEYMFLNDTACNLASLNLMKFRAARRLRLRRRAFRPAVDVTILAQEIIVDNASYPREKHRREQPPLPSARTGLRQPGRAADEPGAGLRQRRGSGLRGGRDRAHVRRGLPPERRDRRSRRAPSPAIPRTAIVHARRHARSTAAARRSTGSACPSRPLRGRRDRAGTRPRPRRETRLSATARSPCSRRPAPSPS